ncbi:substrate-binding periplasmic protein [Methylotetracoccus oryzae]|uniref:substrate-binding periplasmic protein n=1 Tax=Methylotetracoccus oryzae TaxID=1919059 RepID=UPI0011180352|nr:transporter substrate-binding domain-containing protein [Methylotetracoccus oryzae]
MHFHCRFPILLALMAVLAVALVTPRQAHADETLRMAISDWPPYVETTAPSQGLAIEIVRTALDRIGYDMALADEPWSRTLEGASIGVYDALAAAWYNAQRAGNFLFSQPYLINEIKFIKRRGDPFQFRSIDDLRGRVVGIVKDYAYDDRFDQARGLTRFVNNHVLENLLLMLQGQVDVTLDDERVLRYEIDQYMSNSRDAFEILPEPFSRRGLCFAMNRQHPKAREIIKAFDAEIREMQADGTFRQILGKYGN